MAKKNSISIDFNGFAEYAEKIDNLGGNLQRVVSDAMKKAFEQITEDTIEALDKSNLPARGKYSSGDTLDSLIRDSNIRWSGSVGEMPIGFDKSKPGAGGFLITGTPRMKPDRELHKIYKEKHYMRKISKEMEKVFANAVNRLMG